KRLHLHADRILLCLGLLLSLAVLQLVPLPQALISVLSPKASALHHELHPPLAEQLPGEAPTPRPNWLPITIDRTLTNTFIYELGLVLILFIVVRHWLANRDSLQRFAWVAAGTGALLAGVALAQFVTSPRNVIFWRVETEGAVYGPFVCKNHFPDFVNFCLGLCAGLLFRPKDRSDPTRQVSLPQVGNSTFADLMDIIAAIMQSPRRFALVVMGGLMLASLPLSLSRGGMLGTGVALALVGLLVVRERGKSAILRSPVVLIAVIAIGFVSWFGWGPIESQFRNAWAGRVNDTRGPLWAAGLRLVPSFLITGSGAGTFARIEPLARESSGGLNEADVENDHAHNEFLDAILEGGLLRLGITLLLVYAVCIAAWKAAQRLSGRPGGPVAFGLLFGFVSLAVHSITDFGIHIPAVAVIATVATAHALAASTDSGYLKVKRRYRLNADGTQTAVPSRLDANLPEPPPPRLVRFTGRTAMVLPGLFVLFSIVLVASGYSRTEAYS
ncbi:MAG: O-antigen ligase family protein, partial [Gemmataceae bacterium]